MNAKTHHMRNLRLNMDQWFNKLDVRWKGLPVEKQHQYTLYLFLSYVILTATVIGKVCYDASKSRNDMVMEHIENPVLLKKKSPALLQDTVSTIQRSKSYERK